MKSLTYLLRVFPVVCIFLFQVKDGFTQGTTKIQAVPVDLNSKTFKNSLPFDEAFNITAKISRDIVSVDFNYRIKDRKGWHYLPKKDYTNTAVGPDSGYLKTEFAPIEWNRFIADEDSFLVRCGPLHPNTIYQFRFKTRKMFLLPDEQKKLLKARIGSIITRKFDAATTLDAAFIESIYGDIAGAVKNASPDQFSIIELPNGTRFDLTDVSSRASLVAIFGQINLSANKIGDYKTNLNGNVLRDPIERYFITNQINLISALKGALATPAPLHAETQALLKMPVDQSIDEFKTVSGNDFLLMLYTLVADNKYFDLLNGAVKFKGNAYTAASDVDGPSIELLYSFMNKFEKLKFNKPDGSLHPLSALIDALYVPTKSVFTDYQKYKAAIAAREKSLATIPDFTVNMLLTATYIIEESTMVELAAQNTPYVGLDAGIGYSFFTENFFLYYGANFYIRPVNKRTRLNNYKGLDYFLKTVSFYVGVTNSKFGSGSNTRYEATLGGSNDLILGLGYRFNRAMRINTGLQAYFLKDANPLIDKKELRGSPVISLTIDINIINTLGSVSKLLRLTPN